jgi:hypothetical protein
MQDDKGKEWERSGYLYENTGTRGSFLLIEMDELKGTPGHSIAMYEVGKEFSYIS